jgi:hypothetical protein
MAKAAGPRAGRRHHAVKNNDDKTIGYQMNGDWHGIRKGVGILSDFHWGE